MRDWCRTPGGECRHVFLSRVFDGMTLEPCGDRCDVCRKENIAVAAVESFEMRKLRMQRCAMRVQCENAGAKESKDCGL
jgi:hypothetical protein